jgi:hypothetical protein
MTEPAWFYSSLAQSCAAIVGLLGAILGSHILEHLNSLRTERHGLDTLNKNSRRQILNTKSHLLENNWCQVRPQDVEK